MIDAARPCRHVVGSRWFVDETYVKVAGVWRYAYRAVDEYGQVVDVLVSRRRDITAAHRFFAAALAAHGEPDEVIPDRAAVLAHVIVELIADAVHNTEQYANNRTASVIIRGHAFMQNLRRGHTRRERRAKPGNPRGCSLSAVEYLTASMANRTTLRL
jgi:IS6 family transposase